MERGLLTGASLVGSPLCELEGPTRSFLPVPITTSNLSAALQILAHYQVHFREEFPGHVMFLFVGGELSWGKCY